MTNPSCEHDTGKTFGFYMICPFCPKPKEAPAYYIKKYVVCKTCIGKWPERGEKCPFCEDGYMAVFVREESK